MLKPAAIALAALLALPATPRAEAPGVQSGVPYSQVRLQLVQKGYEPAKLDPLDDGGPRCSIGREVTCTLFPETRFCSGTGKALCEFVFRKRGGGGVYTVYTYGEGDDPLVSRIKAMSDSEISRLLAE